MNRICLIGRLVRDPELRITSNGINVTTFTLAIDRDYKNAQGEKETDFVMIQVWRKLAELCANYLSKGKMAAVDGKLRIESYEKDGERKTVAKVVADNVRFLSPKNDAESKHADSIGTEVEASDQIEELPF